ncbi:MAG: hypothetical protein JSW41_03850 [Candidatus Aenigmatarchaeota archaeon]|nr:MAG: hypothetical protein JSW41_03850 [Candidatus Aenigmarchaeota archaeon]
MPTNNDKPGVIEDFVAKYGLTVFLCVILALIGTILIVWSKYTKEGKAWQTYTGVGLIITAGVFGLGQVIWQKSQETDTTTNGITPPINGETPTTDMVPAM